MHFSTLITLLTTTSTLALAAPAQSSPATTTPTNFYLVTTTQSTPAKNSSHLASVSATSFSDPFNEPNYLLRLIGPGYLKLPTFNLTKGTLHSLSQGPENVGWYIYNSTTVQAGQELQFLAKKEGKGNLALKDGYLLTVGGVAKGWSLCPDVEGEPVIVWKGGAKCTDTYIQAVAKAPY